ncbi:hypothetical protein [Candidatus Chlorohelix sp.]|uniref:hypothetical protein n=1 Tax=Candidatus Chlorohelix sp. TaxID=3139201 RepID=UPI00307218D5
MAKEIILSVNSDPKSPKYLMWALDEIECETMRLAIGSDDDYFPLLTTLSDYNEDFECLGERLLGLCQETIDLTIKLEEQHRDQPFIIKLLTMVGGLGALAHDFHMNVYGYAN